MTRGNRPILIALWLPLMMLAGASCAGVGTRYLPASVPEVPPPVTVPTAASPSAPATVASAPLALTATEAVLLSLERNRSLAVQRYAPSLGRAAEEQQRAAFDPALAATVTNDRERTPSGSEGDFASTHRTSLQVAVDKSFPSGTRVEIEALAKAGNASAFDTTRLGVTVTQSLLRGYGSGANLASVRQARIDTLTSEYELRGFAEALASQVEQAYWDHVLATRRLDIVETSLDLAKRQLEETQERIKVGKLAEVELVAARSEVALRAEDLINARSALETSRLKLLRLVNPGGDGIWSRELRLTDNPSSPRDVAANVEEHVALALRMRPDLNQARLKISRGDLEIVRTRNGLLPVLDVFLTLGKTGYSDSFLDSVGEIGGEGYDLSLGISGQLPFVNRKEQATDLRAVLSRRQAAEAVENLAQLVQVDVRSAFIEVARLKEQIAATAATRALQEEKARAESEKFLVGRSTSFQVAMTQRDLLASQVAEVEALVNYMKSLVDLYRLDGSLLERRGIKAPGSIAVEMPESVTAPR